MTSLCSKCGNPGEFRVGHRQCRACERAYGKAYRSRPAIVLKDQAYRESHRVQHQRKNGEIAKRKKVERHLALDALKCVPCRDCGRVYPPYVMDFDHRDPSTKQGEINYLLNKTSAPWATILSEVAKCDVVCVRCHRKRTWVKPKRPLDNRRKLILQLKSAPGVDCGLSFHYSQMDFDHVRGEKLRCVPHMRSCKAILTEAAKCDVVCANCHRIRTQVAGKGAQRVDPATVSMAWTVVRPGSIQTVVVPRPKKAGPVAKPWHALVGKMTDKSVAEHTGVSRASVCMYRKKLGLPRFQRQECES